jgi:hypothetical protein
MNVGQLKKELEQFPDDWDVLIPPPVGAFPPMPVRANLVQQYQINHGRWIIICHINERRSLE